MIGSTSIKTGQRAKTLETIINEITEMLWKLGDIVIPEELNTAALEKKYLEILGEIEDLLKQADAFRKEHKADVDFVNSYDSLKNLKKEYLQLLEQKKKVWKDDLAVLENQLKLYNLNIKFQLEASVKESTEIRNFFVDLKHFTEKAKSHGYVDPSILQAELKIEEYNNWRRKYGIDTQDYGDEANESAQLIFSQRIQSSRGSSSTSPVTTFYNPFYEAGAGDKTTLSKGKQPENRRKSSLFSFETFSVRSFRKTKGEDQSVKAPSVRSAPAHLESTPPSQSDAQLLENSETAEVLTTISAATQELIALLANPECANQILKDYYDTLVTSVKDAEKFTKNNSTLKEAKQALSQAKKVLQEREKNYQEGRKTLEKLLEKNRKGKKSLSTEDYKKLHEASNIVVRFGGESDKILTEQATKLIKEYQMSDHSRAQKDDLSFNLDPNSTLYQTQKTEAQQRQSTDSQATFGSQTSLSEPSVTKHPQPT